MKMITYYFAFLLAVITFTGCSATYQASSGYAADDLYATHDREEITHKQQAENERKQRAWERQAQQRQTQHSLPSLEEEPNYQNVLADDYQSAYARRLRGINSSSYRMPSSIEDAYYSNKFHYVSAYDPAFYNIVVSGDEVWVEPKYVTSMFGSWGATVVAGDWASAWNRPYSPWYSPRFSWSWYYRTNPWWGFSPWYTSGWNPWWENRWWNPYWGGGWHGYWAWDWHWHWGHRYPGWGWGWGHYRPHNYRHDNYPHRNGHYGSGHRYNQGYHYDRRPSEGYNRGRNHRGGYNRGGYNRGSYNNSNRGSYNDSNRGSYNNSYRPSNTSTPSYGSGSSSGGGYRSGGSYNSGR